MLSLSGSGLVVDSANAMVGLRPSLSAHVRWCERGAPVLFPVLFLAGPIFHELLRDHDPAEVGHPESGRAALWYPTSRQKRARCGAPRGLLRGEIPTTPILRLGVAASDAGSARKGWTNRRESSAHGCWRSFPRAA